MKYICAVAVLCMATGCGGGESVTGIKDASVNALPAPRIVEVEAGDRSLTVKIEAPAYAGTVSVTGYEYSIDVNSSWTAVQSSAASTHITIPGLTNGTSYSVRVRATTSGSAGEPSATVSGIPMTVPGAPAITSLTGEADKLRVVFSVPADNGGAAITGYEYTLDEGRTWRGADSVSASTMLIVSLHEQTEYAVALRALNKMGTGPASTSAKAFLLGIADAPEAIEIVAGDGMITVRFRAPAFTAGKPVTGYEYSIDSTVTWKATGSPASSIVIKGLVNGTRYDIAVRAITESGTGHASAISAAIPFVAAPAVEILRSMRKPGKSYYMPQQLDMVTNSFAVHASRALQRFRGLTGRDAVSVFDKVQAAADYVANLAKHPYRHNMSSEGSDPRAWEFADYPEKLADLAIENQSWNGLSWEPAEGKTLLDVPAIECTFQNLILGGVVNALGAQWMIVSITSHDAFAYYDWENGKWIYIDATFNEHYGYAESAAGSYVALSPLELRDMSLRGDNSMFAHRHSYQPQRFETEYLMASYIEMNPLGFAAMAVSLNGISTGSRGSTGGDVRVLAGGSSEPEFAAQISLGWVVAGSDEDLWAPQGETFLHSIEITARGNVVHLSTNLAVAAPTFERSVNGGAWTAVGQSSEINGLTGEIRFRAKYFGFAGGEVIIRQAAK